MALPMFEQRKRKVKYRSCNVAGMGVESGQAFMKKTLRIAMFFLVGSGLCLAGVAKTGRKPAQKPAPAPAPVVEQAPQPPPRPLTPEEMPAVAPRIALTNGLLSITADNSTLGDVLNAVRSATGAAIDVPPAANNERVVVQLGPGQPRDVLQKLLSGSKFDYIIVGSPVNNDSVQRVILTARSSGPGGGQPVQNGAPNQMAVHQTQPVNDYQPPDDVSDVNMDEDEPGRPESSPEIPEVTMPVQPQPGQQGQPGMPIQPGMTGQPGQGSQQQPQQQQNPNGPKTPEQLLQELQQLQQQQGQKSPE
jgi:hypothetical protein